MPIVYWIRDKVNFIKFLVNAQNSIQKRINQSTLTFKKVEHLDHGAYECVVANSVETISTRVMLLVEVSFSFSYAVKYANISDNKTSDGFIYQVYMS